MSHRNARLNVQGRQLLVERVSTGWAVAHAAKAQGVSRQCAHRWVGRFRAEGEAGLQDRSSRPHHCPTQTPVEVEQRSSQLRRERAPWPGLVGPELGVPARTVSRVLRRHGVPYLRECDPLTGEVIRSSKTTAVPLRARPPRRAGPHGRQEDRQDPRRRRLAGPRPADGHHRRQEARPDRLRLRPLHGRRPLPARLLRDPARRDRARPAPAFLLRAAAYFAATASPGSSGSITDNHWCYRRSSDVADAIAALGAKHMFIRPHCPWQNGKVERFNRTLQTEWAYRQVFTQQRRTRRRPCTLARATTTLNAATPHSAAYPPISRLSPT